MKENVRCECFGEKEYSFSVCCQGWNEKRNIIVYSFGIGEDLSFSAQLAKRWKQIEIYAFDPTPKATKYVEQYDKSVFQKFEYYPIGLSDKNIIADFYLPKNPDYVSGSEINNPVVDNSNVIKVQMHTLKHIMTMLRHEKIDLVKMDIEGSEFAVIPQMLEEVGGVEQICVEVHNRFYEDGEVKLKNMLDSLQIKGYERLHISDSKEEMTFFKMI